MIKLIRNLKVNVSLNNASNLFKVWAHGPLDGEVKNINNITLSASVSNVGTYENDIDIRMVFDREYLSNATKLFYVSALDKILAYE